MIVNFEPDQTLVPFWETKSFYRFVIGPYGSTKTTNCIMRLMALAANQAPGPDGKRRTRFVISRPTLQQLKTTVLKDVEQWLMPIMNYKVSENLIEVRAGDIISDWYLIPLEDPEDQRRLLSMQLSAVYFNEFREIPLDLVAAASSRVGRFPSKAHGGCTEPCVIGDTNPPDYDSPWRKFLVDDPPKNLHLTHQPSAMAPEATWRKYLPDNYYENLMEGHDEEWINVHIHSQWGASRSGQPVFKSTFRPSFHVGKSELQPSLGHPLVVGMDFARWPAALVGQVNHQGRLLILAEAEQENVGVMQFMQTVVRPLLSSSRFSRYPVYIVGDPAGLQRSQIGEDSVFSILKKMGYLAYPAQTNQIPPRLRAVERWLLEQREGQAAFLIDPVHCPKTIKALNHEYRFKQRKDGTIEDTPDKSNRPYPDLADALQYLCLGANTNYQGRVLSRMSRPVTEERPITSGGWT